MTPTTPLATFEEAVDLLKHDGLLLYPTETYFGIGCRIGSEEAIARIFKVKKRLYAMPLPIILGSADQMDQVATIPAAIKDDIGAITERFWPGSLSVIVPARTYVSPLLTGGTGNIAMRLSPHPAATELARAAGEPIVASSANISGQQPVTMVSDLSEDLVKAVDAIHDALPTPGGGLASTLIIPLGDRRVKLLREGAVSLTRLEEAGFRI